MRLATSASSCTILAGSASSCAILACSCVSVAGMTTSLSTVLGPHATNFFRGFVVDVTEVIVVDVCGAGVPFDADPHLKHILRHSLGERAQLEGNAAVLARGEEVVERPLPQLPALCKLLLTNVGDCRLLTPGRDACLRHRHAVLCGVSAYLHFSQAAAHVRMLLLLHILAFVSVCVCTCASPCVYLQSYSFNITLFHQILFEMI